MKRTAILVAAVLLVLCCAAAAAGGLAYFYYGQGEEARPVVFISSPAYGEQTEVGEIISVQAVARDEAKVTRVELWVDGELQTSQTSSLPGGISPFPLLASWQSLSPGTHTLIVRAFNAQNARAFASVNVEAVEGADQDGDGVADVLDACPDEPGSPLAAGCPDADADGIPDDEDECPDQAGTLVTEGCPDADGDTVPDQVDACPEEPGAPGAPAGDGCPAPRATDRDGDGIPDSEDECLDQGGSPVTDGCPDADGDGVRDDDDDCPDQPGPPGADGCPVPRGGEDSDGDGVADVDDVCPEEWGLPEYSGCPDTDRDGVPEPDDLRPEDAGPPEAGGAPETDAADSDGDGVPDDIDRCTDDEGLMEHDGCPPAGPETDTAEETVNPLAGLIARGFGLLEDPVEKAAVDVEVEVLWFETDESYNHVYCYVGLAGGEMERYTLSRLGETRWDRVFEGQNSYTVTADDEHLLEMRMECGAYRTYLGEEEGWEEPPYDLGSVIVGHPVAEWDGREFEISSEGGTEGRSFYAKYRLCLYSCEAAGLPAPTLSLVDSVLGHQLVWDWGGVSGEIIGFKLYVNGAFNGNTFDRDVRTWVLPESLVPCGTDSVEFQLTAYSFNPITPQQESPRSNTERLEGSPCPGTLTVRVTFDDLDTYDLEGERRMDGRVGPIFGSFGANGEWLSFDAADYPDGFLLTPGATYRIQDIFDTIWDWQLGRMEGGMEGEGWAPAYVAPDVNYVTVEVGPGEYLIIEGLIDDKDYYQWETIFDGLHFIEPGEIVPGPLYIRDREIRLTVQIHVLSVSGQ